MKCKRCGYCCEITRPEMWEMSDLTDKQKKRLLKERDKYPKFPKERKCRYHYCKMLVFEEGKAVCLIHKLFGYDAKPENCKKFPSNPKELKICKGNNKIK